MSEKYKAEKSILRKLRLIDANVKEEGKRKSSFLETMKQITQSLTVS